MSKFLTPTLYNGRGLENQLRNTIYNAHDLMCGCPKPAEHIKHLLTEEKCQFTEDAGTITNTNKKKIQKKQIWILET